MGGHHRVGGSDARPRCQGWAGASHGTIRPAAPDRHCKRGRGLVIDTTTGMGQAEELRAKLVNGLVEAGTIASAEIEAAFRTVPRHMFAPGVSLEDAYADDIVRTKSIQGVTVSSISAPWLQATMLEQAGLQPGMRCLEIGSGGFNAALMAELVGTTGQVTTVDIDADVTTRARRCLDETGYGRVNVVLADAEHGVPEHAPYDRIIVTVGVWDIPPAWTEQLVDGGRIVVPLRMRGLSRSVAFVREDDHLVGVDHQMAGFVSVQGVGEHPERLVTLHGDDVGLRLDDNPFEPHVDNLRSALSGPRSQAWSGVCLRHMEPFDGLFLWMATTLDDFCLITRARTDQARELVDPASPMATPALVSDTGFAYLTFRPTGAREDPYETGAFGHGPDGVELAEAMTERVRVWDRDGRHGQAQIRVYPADAPVHRLPTGRLIHKRHTNVLISWG